MLKTLFPPTGIRIRCGSTGPMFLFVMNNLTRTADRSISVNFLSHKRNKLPERPGIKSGKNNEKAHAHARPGLISAFDRIGTGQ
jgi:hypothetical protein